MISWRSKKYLECTSENLPVSISAEVPLSASDTLEIKSLLYSKSYFYEDQILNLACSDLLV
jgi:hypothetical protein